jgi:hypothetical protein
MINNPPTIYAEAVEHLIADLSPDNRAVLRDMSESELAIQHIFLGTSVRENYGLWGGNPELMASCARAAEALDWNMAAFDADGAAALIIKGAWEKLRGEMG